MKICDIMSDRVVSVGMDETVRSAAKLMYRTNLGALPVCDHTSKVRGMITDRDIVLRCIASGMDPDEIRVSEIMSRAVISAGPFDEVEKAVRLMSRDQVRRLPVLDGGRLVGIVTLCDMARNCNCDMEAAETLSEISSNFHRR